MYFAECFGYIFLPSYVTHAFSEIVRTTDHRPLWRGLRLESMRVVPILRGARLDLLHARGLSGGPRCMLVMGDETMSEARRC